MIDHYKLHAYVCCGGSVRDPPFHGWATFETIFQQRPDKCRYAVVECSWLKPDSRRVETRSRYVVWDLYDEELLRMGLHMPVHEPGPIYVGDHLDGLIMKVVTLYEH